MSVWVCGLFWAERAACSKPGDRCEHVYFGSCRLFMGKYAPLAALSGAVPFYAVLCSFFYTRVAMHQAEMIFSWNAIPIIWVMILHVFGFPDHPKGVLPMTTRGHPWHVYECGWGRRLSLQVMSSWRNTATPPPIKLPNTMQFFTHWDSNFQTCEMIEFQTNEVPREANTLNLQVGQLRDR